MIYSWSGQEQRIDDLTEKHPSTKLDYKALKDRIVFPDTEIYLHNGKLHTKIYRKETDRQHYLHIKSEHPKWLNDSSPYSQVIQIKHKSSDQVDLNNRLKEMKNNIVTQGYHPSLINEHLKRIRILNRIDLITEKDKP